MFQISNYPDIELIRERISVFDIELPKLLLTDAERPSSISLRNCEKLKNIPLKLWKLWNYEINDENIPLKLWKLWDYEITTRRCSADRPSSISSWNCERTKLPTMPSWSFSQFFIEIVKLILMMICIQIVKKDSIITISGLNELGGWYKIWVIGTKSRLVIGWKDAIQWWRLVFDPRFHRLWCQRIDAIFYHCEYYFYGYRRYMAFR